ncbi:MAG: septation protein A [Rhodobacteraceae bacterium]|nr:septation protein A [Paracoccaceae bacterium]
MEQKKQNPILKLVLEMGPIVIFFLAYRWAPFPEGASDEERQLAQVIFATGVFIPVTLAALGWSWFTTRKLPKMAVITAVIVIIFGGLTLWLQDATFIKMKPTILYAAFGGMLGFGLLRGQSYLRYLMGEMMPLQDEGWMIFTKRFALFFLALAVINELVWRNMDTDIWVNFKTFFLPVATFGFIFSQMGVFQKYAIEEEGEENEETPS